MRAVRVAVDERTTEALLRNRAGNALTTLDARRRANRIAPAAGCRHITRTGCGAPAAPPASSGACRCDMQIAMRHADPYDMAKNNKDRHASHRVASFLAGMIG